jgi:hypothetical protein
VPGLTDAYLKLNWAKRHLDGLDEALQSFHESNPCRFSGKDDLANGKYLLKVELDNVPDEIPLRCGDAFYCMRACLDQLVWSLAKLTVVIPEHTQFPIIESWTADGCSRFKRHLRGVPDAAVAVIRELQPAESATPVQMNHLWRLNAMCNLDKHRRIPANGSHVDFALPKAMLGSVKFEMSETCGVISVPLADKHKLDLHPQARFQVNLGDATAGVNLGPHDIRDIYNFLNEGVLPRFIRFFA